jgi:glycosyltransferase involved in cell wall biosynthesis
VTLLDKQILSKIQFIIIGEGVLKSKLQTQINSLNLSENIKLLGNIENIGQKLNAFDLFVLPRSLIFSDKFKLLIWVCNFDFKTPSPIIINWILERICLSSKVTALTKISVPLVR